MLRSSAALALALFLMSCGKQPDGQGQPTAPQVGYVAVKEESVTLSTELAGRTSPYETSDVRPQVNGLIRARLFQEGDQVKAGQPLYHIDPAPYEAQVASARAALERARSAIASSDALVRRYAELVKINAVSRQDYDNALTAAGQAHADVAAQQAALNAASIDLRRTTVTAPISGRIGRSAFTTGALVSASQAGALTTIQRLDPIYVDITQSSADQLRLRQKLLAGQLSRDGNSARVRLTLEDGTVYPVEGVVKFTDVTVDPSTGSQTIRAQFANPNGLLLPGMYVRATFVEGTQDKAILVPQRAVSRDEKGQAVVMVIGQGDKLEPRMIKLSRTIGDNWLVISGLKPGDRVAVEGTMNLQPGTPVKAAPWSADKAGKAAAANKGA
ncbi:MAG: efflux RND transporter periplasmic adaptor subunit [Sphingomonadales bacterium]|nr:MAG: efflux RND transporter periplasmic adaptor subunit [Sphingomonadales bacterium]TNF03683.1 MAG: efflux RND transporter periplasmic adaptor subunit [Sphingomonadales bacterium]